jgi:hypothetical protein
MSASRSGVSRVLSPAAGFTWYTVVASLAMVGGACTETLDAGHNRPPDPCSALDAGLPGCVPPALLDKLVGYWRLDDGMGSTVAHDSSGRGNDGVLHDLDPSTAWVGGRWQGALDVAHAGWVQVPPSSSIDSIKDGVTLGAWIDFEGTITSPDNFATALSRQIGTGIGQYYHLSVFADGHPSLLVATVSGFQMVVAPAPAPKGAWTHLTGVYDGAAARLYVNGAEVVSKALTGTFDPDTTSVILGGNGNDASGIPTELFPGRLDELFLYARALGATEIAQIAAGALIPGSRDAGSD